MTVEPITAKRAAYVPAVGPKLRILLVVVFASFALLAATGAYLGAVSLLNYLRAPESYTSQFTLWMFLGHGVVGVLAIVPFLWFGMYHWITSRQRQNRKAVRLGKWVFLGGLAICGTGVALFQFEEMPQLPTGTWGRWIVYLLHLLIPLLVVVVYLAHRRAGPPIRWRWGIGWGAGTLGFTGLMLAMHWQQPHHWFAVGSPEGDRYFHPSSARTADGKFIPAETLMMDSYCMKCHQDIYNDWFHSSHRFSSFNNPAYLFSVRETRQVGLKRDGNVKSSRWCAGCHDPVPFFSGAFDDPNYDDVNHPTAHAGITCTACHAITHLHDTTGNASFTISNPPHYPFAASENKILQFLNQQLVKAKPDFHKQTFLKPFHKTAEFCSTCHKVSLPPGLNHYREFLRGQNHHDSFKLSGVSGHGARSFYYPPEAKPKCADCHMPLQASNDFGAKDFDGSGQRKVHSHFFPAANTGLPELVKNEERYRNLAAGMDQAIQRHAEFLQDNKIRVDIFALKEGGTIEGKLLGPLRPALPELTPGQTYLVEVVVRTVNIGHHFSQGTVDSNEIWVDFTAKSGERVIGRNGALQNPDDSGPLDEWAHRINVLMLDRYGQRIDRRNPQDIFTPLYDHQIPPGAANVVHYQLSIPPDVTGPVELMARVRYRKFDYAYMEYVHKEKKIPVPKLPVVDMCQDRVVLPVARMKTTVPGQASPIKPAWQRWNDYGIACFLEGGAGGKRGETRQAAEAFRKLVTLEEKDAVSHGHLNLARVLIEEGKLKEAGVAIEAARTAEPPAAWWLVAWFSGVIQAELANTPGDLDRAIGFFEQIVAPVNQPRDRRFDFTKDYVVLDRLAQTLYRRSQMEKEGTAQQNHFLWRAVHRYQEVLQLEPEMLDTHYGLAQCYARWSAENIGTVSSTAPTLAELSALVSQVADSSGSQADRKQAALRLPGELRLWCEQPIDVHQPRLPVLRQMAGQLYETFHQDQSSVLRAELAAVLCQLHQQIHAILKPDELARSEAIRIYRSKHPAASASADPVVIYPTGQKEKEKTGQDAGGQR